ncbi:MAG: anion permease [Bacteroidia bacterium]|nr:anion permease [Bacteroidia bacterium]NNF32403.1 DASS family sodium-coupled anion symporter [Flavobacteriaceae bacterium]NNJ82407.1 DASS family sodium-coupled anion symporter [Flavobacteriaceae bacterium]NNK55443.1 DASS family sodium-coupled anion symporter [Flavobacteriaceae bacterium]
MKEPSNNYWKIRWIKRIITLVIGIIIWHLPIPWDLSPASWYLFTIFITAILGVLIDALSIFTASVLALVAAVILGVLTPEKAFSGFSESFILLILAAFLVAKGVIKSGLGRRIAFLLIRRFGKSTLNLGYCIVATDTLLGPAIPSNTARSGILYPITQALSLDTGSHPTPESRKKTGSYLMMTAISGHTISSALWFTGMAANPVGAGIAAQFGVNMNFGNWVFVASVPCLLALIAIPFVLYKLFPPENKHTPEAPEMAGKALHEMGPMSKQEWIMGITFFGMILLWAFSPILNLNLAIVAFLGLSILILSNVYTLEDIRQGAGDALETYVWFAILYMMSTALNEMGFMKTLGAQIATYISDFNWITVYILLTILYVIIHYLFVSQTAQLLALYAVFLQVAVNAEVPAALMAFMLSFATNYFAVITPQASSSNVLFAGSGYLSSKDIYKQGAVITILNTAIFLLATPWIIWSSSL